MPQPHQAPLRPSARPMIWLCGICVLSGLLGCQTAQPAPLPVRAPCLESSAVPALPTLRVETLPADAPGVVVVKAMVLDREALIEYAAVASVLLAGCAR